jgi:hypothetical protein
MERLDYAQKYLEYLSDPIALIEEHFQTLDATQGKYVPLKLFIKQRELLNKYHTQKHVLVNKPRQAGISTITAAYIAAVCALTGPENPYRIIIVANKGIQAQDFLSKIKEFLTQVPIWIWGNHYDHNKEVDGHLIGKGSVKSIKLFNGCHISAVATSKDAIRGASSPRIIVLDEAAHLTKVDSETMFASAMMSLSSNAEGQMFLISTPNGNDPIFFKTYHETKANGGENRFTVHEMYFFQDPRYNKNLRWKKKINDEDEDFVVEYEVDFNNIKMEQRFKDGWIPESDWFLDQCAIMHYDRVQINRELLSRFEGSGNNVVSDEVLEKHVKYYVKDPISKEDSGLTWIFEDPIIDHQYVAFADNSSGSGEDYSALQIINMTTGDQALEFKGKVKDTFFAEIVIKNCYRYNALLDVDVTGGYGENLLNTLLNRDFKLLKKDPSTNEAKGFKFLVNTRIRAIQKMITYIEELGVKIASERLISEFKTYIWINGRPDHMRGFNDDLIMSLAGAIWLFENAFMSMKKYSEKEKSIMNAWIREDDELKQKLLNERPKALYQNGINMSEYLWLLK